MQKSKCCRASTILIFFSSSIILHQFKSIIIEKLVQAGDAIIRIGWSASINVSAFPLTALRVKSHCAPVSSVVVRSRLHPDVIPDSFANINALGGESISAMSNEFIYSVIPSFCQSCNLMV